MIDEIIKAATTSKIIEVWLADSSSTTGAGLTGLLFNAAGLTAYYSREDQGNAGGTAITLATMTRGTWATGGFIEKDATNEPGVYQLGIPDAVLASGAKWAKIVIKGASNLAPKVIHIALPVFDLYTASTPQTGDNYARLGAPAGASTAADVAAVKALLPTALAADGSIKASVQSFLGTAFTEGVGGQIAAAFKKFFNIASPAATMDHGVLVDTVTTYTGNTVQTGDAYARLGAPAGASTAADIAAVKSDTGGLVTKLGGITLLKNWLGALAGKQAADATAQTEIRATGAGSGTFDPTTDALEALRDATLNADIKKINGTTVNGDGSSGTPWGP